MWTHVDRGGERGQKSDFCGRHKWMAPKYITKTSKRLKCPVMPQLFEIDLGICNG